MPVTHIVASLRTRAALGLRPVTAPLIVFIPIGVLAGPYGLQLLSHDALGHLDIIVAVALATLGTFIGLAAGREGLESRRVFAASTIEAGVTMAVVGGALTTLFAAWHIPLALPAGLIATALAVCASASAAPFVDPSDRSARAVAARVADLDDVLPIVLGGAVIALAAATASEQVLWRIAITAGLGVALGTTGLLLLEQAVRPAERGVYVLGLLALAGGTASYLGLSPLLAGLAAGWLLSAAPGGAHRMVAAELAKVQHPLVVLLLVAAGARLQLTLVGLWLFAPYVVFRISGKLLGGWAASRVAPAIAPSDLGAHLITPGVIGIAFALNVEQVAPGVAGAIVFAVAAGSIACEVIAIFVAPAPEPRAG